MLVVFFTYQHHKLFKKRKYLYNFYWPNQLIN
ncbi:hypothetical protein HMPREF0774_1559 [Staphylococcus aureus subsp. aureus TCH130]|nr:hypothetical protein USA300HOU_2479 [Staphylococcus aureus subsp. aureus USA300_TCH1516]EES94826.1 hypothetical protein HMPREF0776_0541 [Staphylococcus aureus subsp. aureus USA300_TCH959]EES96507.1 hypothetical protein HMPREF0774_1559 [Staphylococcus aureus subsp. aureus TCH130]EFT86850.1 hypothetical protein CGSSa03_12180 [Staphylococcus aureus subsp. aureus CGS03]EFU26693.1 hypothetical protein CGSSa01_01321 [Staphylococcus aureus subsp. aureus CGS01]